MADPYPDKRRNKHYVAQALLFALAEKVKAEEFPFAIADVHINTNLVIELILRPQGQHPETYTITIKEEKHSSE